MGQSYRAVLHGDRLEWTGPAPAVSEPIDVVVTLREGPVDEAERGKRMAAILREMAADRSFSSITDPVEWQREIRQDRSLPGRD